MTAEPALHGLKVEPGSSMTRLGRMPCWHVVRVADGQVLAVAPSEAEAYYQLAVLVRVAAVRA